jgi:hypothetical protein
MTPSSDNLVHTAPAWMSWALGGCLLVFFSIILTIDMNGNVVLSESTKIPDLLRPAPAILMTAMLVGATAIALARTILYRSRRSLWLSILAILVLLALATVLPML